MKNETIFKKISRIIPLAYEYAQQHEASHAAMNQLYRMPGTGDGIVSTHTSVIIEITPYGSLYRVSQKYYQWNELQRENNWIASYGWHSNGHLMEIGGSRYCIFDPAQRQLFLEYFDDDACEKKVEMYTAI